MKTVLFLAISPSVQLTRFALFHENGEIMRCHFNVWYKTCFFMFDVRVLSFKRQWENLQKTVGKILERDKLPWFLIRSVWCRSNLFLIHWHHSNILAILASWVAEMFPYSLINLWKNIIITTVVSNVFVLNFIEKLDRQCITYFKHFS